MKMKIDPRNCKLNSFIELIAKLINVKIIAKLKPSFNIYKINQNYF